MVYKLKQKQKHISFQFSIQILKLHLKTAIYQIKNNQILKDLLCKITKTTVIYQ